MTKLEFKQWVSDEATEDFLGLWAIVRVAYKLEYVKSRDDCKKAVVEVLSELMSEGTVVGGLVDKTNHFEPTMENVPELLSRVINQWNMLGDRDPNVGEIAWFTRLSEH